MCQHAPFFDIPPQRFFVGCRECMARYTAGSAWHGIHNPSTHDALTHLNSTGPAALAVMK
jgi:hypothetical protein